MEAKVILTTELQLKAIVADAVTAALKYHTHTTEHRPGTNEEKPRNLKEAADFLGCAEQTIYQNIKKIPHRKRFGKLYFFESELLDYLKGATAQ